MTIVEPKENSVTARRAKARLNPSPSIEANMTTESAKANPPKRVKPILDARDFLTISGAIQHTAATPVGRARKSRTPRVVREPQYTIDAEYPHANQYTAPQPNRATPMDSRPARLDGQAKASLHWIMAAS